MAKNALFLIIILLAGAAAAPHAYAQPLAPVSTELAAAATTAVGGDTNVTGVALASTSVSLAYPVRARLFGVIPVTLTARAQVEPSGAAEIKYPWYGFLFSTDDAAIQTKLQVVGAAARAYNTDAFAPDQQLALLSLMHAALQNTLEVTAHASGTVQ